MIACVRSGRNGSAPSFCCERKLQLLFPTDAPNALARPLKIVDFLNEMQLWFGCAREFNDINFLVHLSKIPNDFLQLNCCDIDEGNLPSRIAVLNFVSGEMGLGKKVWCCAQYQAGCAIRVILQWLL